MLEPPLSKTSLLGPRACEEQDTEDTGAEAEERKMSYSEIMDRKISSL
jgi:hypothetical protein